jgi:hypothetical protein
VLAQLLWSKENFFLSFHFHFFPFNFYFLHAVSEFPWCIVNIFVISFLFNFQLREQNFDTWYMTKLAV